MSLLSLAALPAGASVYDVNGDGVVDINDVNRVVNTILGRASWSTADVNGDGRVNVQDLNKVVNVMLGRNITRTFTVGGVTFRMVQVEGGTFTMGGTSEQGSDTGSNEKPTHQVTLSDYYIGETEVTQALWQAVMGTNPSNFAGDTNRPVEGVSWTQAQQFIAKLNALTGENFALPTEAEWEYAARGGNRSNHYKYAGSNTVDNVAWHKNNSSSTTHPVAQKQRNELGLYDMSGNVWEMCQDWVGTYSSSAQVNPAGPATGTYHVLRGGSYNYAENYARVSMRGQCAESDVYTNMGLRLVLKNSRTYTVNGVSFTMTKVDGGTFTMGATSEQGSDAQTDEAPTHQVTLSDYYIGTTEVTQALWRAVMGSNPSGFTGNLQRPVEKVSYSQCLTFINKLNELTGETFALPTEAEWEYAARGGNKSNGSKYAGDATLGNVGWYYSNSGSATHPVAQKQANELGLYDMSGNVGEWCADWYGAYGSSALTNPTGPSTGSKRVVRGGCWNDTERSCRTSYRFSSAATSSNNQTGLRLVKRAMHTLSVDVVMCIDVTGSMSDVIGTVKNNAIAFYDQFKACCSNQGIELRALTTQVIGFRDKNEDASWLEKSATFTLPDQATAFETFVNSLRANGGGDTPESGLEALQAAFNKSDWGVDDGHHRQVVILWTDAPYLIGTYASVTLDELASKWNTLPSGRRLVLFAPNGTCDHGGNWNALDSWVNVMHETNISKGFNDFQYILKAIIGELTASSALHQPRHSDDSDSPVIFRPNNR